MHMNSRHRPRTVALAAALLFGGCFAASPAFAVNKDMVELQTQVQNLQDAVARLQQSNDERMGVLKDLVQQSADTVNKMSNTVDGVQKQLGALQDANGGKIDQINGQVGALNDSLDEIKARLGRLEKALQDLQTQQQSINATLQNMSPAAAGAPAASGALPPAGQTAPATALPPISATEAPAPAPSAVPQASRGTTRGKPSAGIPLNAVASGEAPMPAPAPATPTQPSAADLYKTALGDFMAAKYPLATSEFSEVIRLYPDQQFSGNAFYYLGEIDYRNGKFANAVRNYDHVLEQFPDNPKVPVSRLHKGMALFAMKDNEAGARELRDLIARFPTSPEATQARSKLNGMGIPITPKKTVAQ